MEKRVFNFGKVKGKEMIEVLNMENIHGGFSGLQYLYGMYNRTSHEYIKEKISECFKVYAGDYVIKFGRYKGNTLSEIDEINKGYLENYLINNSNEEIAMIVKEYMRHCRTNNIDEYNDYQVEVYNKYSEIMDEINNSSYEDIERVIRYLGFEIENKKFRYCPWGCDSRSKVHDYHAYLKRGVEGSYFIKCFKCGNGKSQNFIKFVSEQKNITYKEAVQFIATILGITVVQTNLSTNYMVKKRVKRNEEMVLHKKTLKEINNLDDFGFREGVYPPYYYKRGFNKKDGSIMDVNYAGQYCRNTFRSRICFKVKDLDQKTVGVVGRFQYEEDEFYDYWIKRLGIDKNLDRQEQIAILKEQNTRYKKYYNTNGFESGFVLYNANNLVKSDKSEIFIMEGPFDVMSMVCRHGYKNSVGMFGKNISSGQLYQLYSLYKEVRDDIKIYLFVDNDEAGLSAFENNVKMLQEIGFKNVYKMVLEDGAKDAAEANKEQVDDAYKNAQLQPIKYKKKRIVIHDCSNGERVIDEE